MKTESAVRATLACFRGGSDLDRISNHAQKENPVGTGFRNFYFPIANMHVFKEGTAAEFQEEFSD